MCGIIGISAENNVAEEIYESLLDAATQRTRCSWNGCL